MNEEALPAGRPRRALRTRADAAFRCVDEKGRTHIGDTPPAGCANVVMYEVTRGGQVIRKIEPTLTEDQLKARTEAEEQGAHRREGRGRAETQGRGAASHLRQREGVRHRARPQHRAAQAAHQASRGAHQGGRQAREGRSKEEMEFYKAGKKKSEQGARTTPPTHGRRAASALTEEKKHGRQEHRGLREGDRRDPHEVRRGQAALGRPQEPRRSRPPPRSEAKAEPVKADEKAAKK